MLNRLALLLSSVVVALLLASAPAQAYPEYASYYGSELEGAITASGDVFYSQGYTAASWEYPLGTILSVCYDGCVTVTVNDRGPAAWTGNTLDVSEGAADAIGLSYAGQGTVDAVAVGYDYRYADVAW